MHRGELNSAKWIMVHIYAQAERTAELPRRRITEKHSYQKTPQVVD